MQIYLALLIIYSFYIFYHLSSIVYLRMWIYVVFRLSQLFCMHIWSFDEAFRIVMLLRYQWWQSDDPIINARQRGRPATNPFERKPFFCFVLQSNVRPPALQLQQSSFRIFACHLRNALFPKFICQNSN